MTETQLLKSLHLLLRLTLAKYQVSLKINVSAICVRWENPLQNMTSANHAGKRKHRRRNSWEDVPRIPTINCKIRNILVKGPLCD